MCDAYLMTSCLIFCDNHWSAAVFICAICGIAITKCCWSYPTWWQWAVCWCIYIQLINVTMSDYKKSLWSTDVNISLDKCHYVLIITKSSWFLDDPSWSCHGESFTSMQMHAELSPVLMSAAAFISSGWSGFCVCVLEIVLFLALCSFPPFPNYSNVHADLAMQCSVWVTEFIVCLWSVDFWHHLPEVFICWY